MWLRNSGKSTFYCLVLAVTFQAALAGAVDECVPLSPSGVIVRSCTEIIQSPSFGSDQKAPAYKYRGDVRLQAGALQAAIADFTESIRLKKENALAFAGRGWAKFVGGDLAESIVNYSEAIRLSPTSAELFIERGHVNIVADKTEDAIRDLTEALRLDPKNADAFNRRGLAYLKKGDLIRAQKDYDAAIKLEPLIAVFYANRGYVYRALDKKKNAVDDFTHALELDPSLTEAMNALKMLKPAANRTRTDQLIRQGKQLVDKNCRECHAVGASDVSRNKNAPEFRNFSRRYPHLTLRPPIERAIATKSSINLSFDETEAIIAYIDSFVKR
jgi:tetratricopeptide (TPR) repeat protein